MMPWVMVLFMHGWPVDVDRFITREQCEEKVRMYNRASRQINGSYLVWCEHRPQS